MKYDLENRLFEFSINVIKSVKKLPDSQEFKVISYQLLKSATSIGANYEEAKAAVSKADFANKIGISLKEARETNYWIRILLEICQEKENWGQLRKESEELVKILAAIYNKTACKK